MEENDPDAETEKPHSASTKTSLNPSAGVDETEKRHGPLDASGECRSTELQQQAPHIAQGSFRVHTQEPASANTLRCQSN